MTRFQKGCSGVGFTRVSGGEHRRFRVDAAVVVATRETRRSKGFGTRTACYVVRRPRSWFRPDEGIGVSKGGDNTNQLAYYQDHMLRVALCPSRRRAAVKDEPVRDRQVAAADNDRTRKIHTKHHLFTIFHDVGS